MKKQTITIQKLGGLTFTTPRSLYTTAKSLSLRNRIGTISDEIIHTEFNKADSIRVTIEHGTGQLDAVLEYWYKVENKERDANILKHKVLDIHLELAKYINKPKIM